MHRQKTANLLEERLKIVLGHGPSRLDGGHKIRSIQPASATDELIKQRQPLLVRGLITQIPADQIQDSEWKQRVEIAFEHALLIGQLAHALLQLDSLHQQLRRRFISALTLFFHCCIATRQSGQQGEISFPSTAERRCLGWLQPMTRHLERLEGSMGFP